MVRSAAISCYIWLLGISGPGFFAFVYSSSFCVRLTRLGSWLLVAGRICFVGQQVSERLCLLVL